MFQESMFLVISAFFCSILSSASITKLLIRASTSLRLLDEPDEDRKFQAHAIPSVGGISIFITLSLFALVGIFTDSLKGSTINFGLVWFLPVFIMFVVGLIDDILVLTSAKKFIGQFIAATFGAIVSFVLNLRSEFFENEFLNIFITLSWIILLTNALNFADNHDGASTLISINIFTGIAIISAISGQSLIFVLALAHIGPLIGFLIFNYPEAKAYLGDAGSLFLGASIGILTLRVDTSADGAILSLASIIILVFLLILDTSSAIITRLLGKRSIFYGGRDHISHRLTKLGKSKYQVLAIIFAFSILNLFIFLIINLQDRAVGTLAIISWIGMIIYPLSRIMKVRIEYR